MTKAPSPSSLQMLFVMNLLGYPMYEGTVPRKEKLRRRAANKAARKSRRANRR
jgi:hypothetical protein